MTIKPVYRLAGLLLLTLPVGYVLHVLTQCPYSIFGCYGGEEYLGYFGELIATWLSISDEMLLLASFVTYPAAILLLGHEWFGKK